MTIVAFDQALQRFGVAIYREGRIGGPVVTPMSQNFERFKPEERLEAVMSFVRALLDVVDERPATVAVEETWVGENRQTAVKLGRLQGSIIEAARGRGFEVERVPPTAWQESAGIELRRGRWRAKSEDIKRASLRVAALRGNVDPKVLTEDSADAVNIAFHVAGVLRLRKAAA